MTQVVTSEVCDPFKRAYQFAASVWVEKLGCVKGSFWLKYNRIYRIKYKYGVAADRRLSIANIREMCCWQTSVNSKKSINLLVTDVCQQHISRIFARQMLYMMSYIHCTEVRLTYGNDVCFWLMKYLSLSYTIVFHNWYFCGRRNCYMYIHQVNQIDCSLPKHYNLCICFINVLLIPHVAMYCKSTYYRGY